MGAAGSMNTACATGGCSAAVSAGPTARAAPSTSCKKRIDQTASLLPLLAEPSNQLPLHPPPPPLTGGALEALAAEAGAAFSAALTRLAKQEHQRCAEERKRLEDRSAQLRSIGQKLQEERERFEEERKRYAKPHGTERSDVVRLNVGGQAAISVSRATLTQCEDSMLASCFNGTWEELPKDEEGQVFIDYSPALFIPLVEHLRLRRREEAGQVHALSPPVFEDPARDEHFLDMLRHYRMLDWVYRQPPVKHKVIIGDFVYSVLPPVSPDFADLLSDERGADVTVPRGWQPLQSSAMYFELIIRELTSHGWGAGSLLVKDEKSEEIGFGFASSCSCSGTSRIPKAGSGMTEACSCSASGRSQSKEGDKSSQLVKALERTASSASTAPSLAGLSRSSATSSGSSPSSRDVGSRGGFVGFRTRFSSTGAAGSRVTDPPTWFQAISDNGRSMTFSASGYRVVIRTRVKPHKDPTMGFKVLS